MATRFGQKFVTTGYSDGCRIHVLQENPASCIASTIPTHVRLQLFRWYTNYYVTITGTSLVTEDVIVASEHIEDNETWLYLLWKSLEPGTYLWLLTVDFTNSHNTGTFQVIYDPDSTKFDSFEEYNTAPLGGDFESEIFNLGSDLYEFVLSTGDNFTTTYNTDDGHDEIKINRGTSGIPNHVNSIKSQDAVVNSSNVKIGRIGSGSLVKL